jgi:hypothetical protein
MAQDPTVQPTVPRADLGEETRQLNGDVEETAQPAVDAVADTVSNIQLKTTDRARSAIAGDANESPLSSVAAVLMGDCATFINTLFRAVEADITPAIFRTLRHAARSESNEAAAFDRLAVVAIDDAKPSTAAKICAAMAARIAGLSWQRANGALGPTESAELFTAWLETARAMIAARGFAGLRRLLPTARLLARRSAERGDSAAEIAATMHRIAARIVAELSLERPFDLAAADQELDATEQRPVSPGSAPGSQSPAQMTLHPR